MSFVDKVDLVKIEFKHGEKGNWDTWTQDLERFLTRKSLLLFKPAILNEIKSLNIYKN